MAAFRVGRTTSDLEDEGTGTAEALAEGETERFRLVVGLPFPFFLKNGTFTSVEDSVWSLKSKADNSEYTNVDVMKQGVLVAY